MDLINYSSYITGRRVAVNVRLVNNVPQYDFKADGSLTESDYILLSEEAAKQAQLALSSKILLG